MVRQNSFSIEDAFFGDSGKGSVVAKLIYQLSRKGNVFSLRYNGGSNAGHETYFNGIRIVTHQLPMAVIQKDATALITRGMVIHPEDLLTEIKLVGSYFSDSLPGTLIIDERVTLVLDTHRALEKTFNNRTSGGRGSTNRGIASAYNSFYGRYAVTLKDLLSSNWKDYLKDHYLLYQDLISGFGIKLAKIDVYTMSNQPKNLRPVGSLKEFLKRLEIVRKQLKQYISKQDIKSLLEEKWNNSKIPFVIEGAQGAGLDPYHGVYPDTTASRPMSRNINDATYNVIQPEEIQFRLAVMKTTYLSSVGQRTLPSPIDTNNEKWIQEEFDERGRSTGRLRDIYPISIPIAQYLKKAAGYNFLVATHLDASVKNKPIKIITHYTNKKTGEEKSYLPYQDELDKLVAHYIELPGWDGQAIKKVRSNNDLPSVTKKYFKFLSKNIAPVIYMTTGPDLDEYISLIPSL